MKPTETLVRGVFDCETTTVDGHAFACVYTCMDVQDNGRDGAVHVFRHAEECVSWIEQVAEEGERDCVTPIVAVYNLRFDWYAIGGPLEEAGYSFESFTSGSRLFAIDAYRPGAVIEDETPAVRFWNVQPLVPEGLAVMGELAGCRKLEGHWDYEDMRGPETELSSEEIKYCEADVKVISKFLRFLLKEFTWLRRQDFGRVAMTPAGIARLYQQRVIGPVKMGRRTVGQDWHSITQSDRKAGEAAQELRRQAYAGGFTFLNESAYFRTVMQVHQYDIDSAYHWALVHLPLTTDFTTIGDETALAVASGLLAGHAERIRENGIDKISDPLDGLRGHWRIRLSGVRLAEGFNADTGIGFVSERRAQELARITTNATGPETGKVSGKKIRATFSRITSAEVMTITCDEYEFAALCVAYKWDALTVEAAEVATRTRPAHPFTRLSSLALRAEKKDRKARGGAQYDFFKRVYNSQAGIYAETDREGFSNAYLPLAVRLTSFTRLALLLAARDAHDIGLDVISGDTDSLKLQGDRTAAEKVAKLHAIRLKMCETPVTDFEIDCASERVKPNGIPEDIGNGLGSLCFECESWMHRELGLKQRVYLKTGGGEAVIKYAGLKLGKLEKAVNEWHKSTRAKWIYQMRPWTWLDRDICPETSVAYPEKYEPRLFKFVDRDGKRVSIEVWPCAVVRDEMACLALPVGQTAQRLKHAGLFEDIREGYMSRNGYEEF